MFEDRRFVVVDKPAGLPVHPGPRGGASVEDWFPLLSRRKDGPWLAHRLDADTAGCLVVALRKSALVEAQACFAGGLAGKRYWAVVSGVPSAQKGRIDAPLFRHNNRDGWRMRTGPDGQPACTLWRVMGTAPGLAWLELSLLTGRTHQARIHCATLGHPILGDPVYGPSGNADRLHLLARSITLPLDPPVAATALPPPHMLAALRRCGFS